MSPWLSHCLVHSQKAVIRTCISTSLLSANRDFATAEIHQHAEPAKPQAQTIKYNACYKTSPQQEQRRLSGRRQPETCQPVQRLAQLEWGPGSALRAGGDFAGPD
jgi:hypothetical protein